MTKHDTGKWLFTAITEYETTEVFEEITNSQKRLDELCKQYSKSHEERIKNITGISNSGKLLSCLQDPEKARFRLSYSTLKRRRKIFSKEGVLQDKREQFGKLKISIKPI